MYFVYILHSIEYPEQLYIGYTQDLEERLSHHNSGKVFHTEKYKPWEIKMYLAFSSKEKAIQFEQYLKSHSGRVFRERRLI